MSALGRLLKAVLSIAIVLAAAALVAWGFTLLPVASEPDAEAPVVTTATVEFVADGDTAQFRLAGGSEERVRFIGIDTPELGPDAEPDGREAAEYTKRLLPAGITVWLETDTELRDKHGRLLAYVWLERPMSGDAAEMRARMLNARIVRDGLGVAFRYPPNVKYADDFARLESEAREDRRGLWSR